MKYRKTKIFDNKKIIIRSASKSDLKQVKKFQDFINSFINEDAMILFNKKIFLKEETTWLKNQLTQIKKHKLVYLIAEHNNALVGSVVLVSKIERQDHVADFGITIKNGYRGIGLGKYLIKEIIKLAKKELKPKPKIITFDAFANNKPAISLYKKMGFKQVGKIPRQFQYKGKLVDEIIMLKDL